MARNNCVETDLIRTVFDVMPSLVLVVDDDVRVQAYNAAAAKFLADDRQGILKRRGGEVLGCLHAAEDSEGCGHASFCRDCVIRNSVNDAFGGNRVVRRRARMEVLRSGEKPEIYALITASPFQYEERDLVLLVIEDISEIAELQRMIPICSVCRKVQDEKETWSRVEAYFKEKWDVDFSHGLCPSCFKAETERLRNDLKAARTLRKGRGR